MMIKKDGIKILQIKLEDLRNWQLSLIKKFRNETKAELIRLMS